MFKQLQIKSWLLMIFMVLGASNVWAADETITFADNGYSNGQAIESVNGNNFTITFNKGTNNNAPKYYTTGSAIRTYGGNYFTVSSDYTIKAIGLTFASGEGSNAITTDKGTYENGSWTGEENAVTFTIGGTTGHRRIASITVTYETGGVQKTDVATVISVNAPQSMNIGATGTFVLNATFATQDYTVAWESSKPEVLAVNGAAYEAKAAGKAEVTVKITPTDQNTYNEVSHKFSVTVVDPNANDGSAEKPFTVAEVIAFANAQGSTASSEVYVKGIVSKVDSYNSKYGSITYWISDDGTLTSAQFQIYSGLGLNEAKFTSVDDVTVGDEVVVCGKAKMHNTTPEFDYNNYLVSTTHQTVQKTETTVTISGELSNLDVYVSTEAGTLTATVMAGNDVVNGATVTWSSSNENVATIDENGVVTLVAKGTVTFTAAYAGDDTYAKSSATTNEYTVTSSAPSVVYSKITDASQLVEGAEYLLVCESKSVALGAVTNIGSKVEVEIENDQISITNEAVNVLTLTAAEGGNWNLSASLNDGAYLAWISGNSLTTSDEAAAWTITFVNGVPTITYATDVTRKLQYNASSPRFCAYTSPLTAVALYIKGEAPAIVSTVAVGDAGWTSYVANQNVTFPTSVKAYTVTAINEETVTLTEVTAVKAYTPVLVNAAKGSYTLEAVDEADCDDTSDNLLKASDGNVKGDALTIFALGQNNGTVGLYLVAADVVIPAGKAYLQDAQATGGVKAFDFGGETAIQNVEATNLNAPIYNVAGQRVNKAVKGLYIQNGRKFIVK